MESERTTRFLMGTLSLVLAALSLLQPPLGRLVRPAYPTQRTALIRLQTGKYDVGTGAWPASSPAAPAAVAEAAQEKRARKKSSGRGGGRVVEALGLLERLAPRLDERPAACAVRAPVSTASCLLLSCSAQHRSAAA